jgi:predicted dehydrogenase
MNTPEDTSLTRRSFVRLSALTAGAGILATHAVPRAFGATTGSDRIRVGLIGCGGRGAGAAKNCLDAAPGVEIVALADLFPRQTERLRERFKVPAEMCFHGFDNYLKLLATDVDLVILAAPPGFRPSHFAAAVAAGKHVFMEKPVAVDPVGARAVIEASRLAKQKGLGVGVGTQRRHQASYLEVMKRIHDGDLGELVGG